MKYNKIIIYLFLFAILYIFIKPLFTDSYEHFYSDTTLLTYTTDGQLSTEFLKILKEYQFVETKNGYYFFPFDYNPCEKNAKKLINSKHNYLYVMDGCDIVGSKIDLWKVLRNDLTTNIAIKYIPTSPSLMVNTLIDSIKTDFKP